MAYTQENNNETCFLRQRTYNIQVKALGYLQCRLLHCQFFFLSTLRAGAVLKALADTIVPVVGGVCPDEAAVTASIVVVPAEGGVCPSMASATPVDGSTVMEGISCPFTVSSSATSPIFFLACLGFEELELKIQEREEFSQNHHEKVTKKHS
jgi:hypothetical protein